MSLIIDGSYKQLVRFAEEAGLNKPRQGKSETMLIQMARGNDTLLHAFEMMIPSFKSPKKIVESKIDHEMVSIYKTLMVKCR